MIVRTELHEGAVRTHNIQADRQRCRGVDAQIRAAKEGKGAEDGSQREDQDSTAHRHYPPTGQSSWAGPSLAFTLSGGGVAAFGLRSPIRWNECPINSQIVRLVPSAGVN